MNKTVAQRLFVMSEPCPSEQQSVVNLREIVATQCFSSRRLSRLHTPSCTKPLCRCSCSVFFESQRVFFTPYLEPAPFSG